MKILVTGGTGRIGANLVKRLLDRGHDIRSFVYPGDSSRADKPDDYDRVETVVGDLRNLDAVKHPCTRAPGPMSDRLNSTSSTSAFG